MGRHGWGTEDAAAVGLQYIQHNRSDTVYAVFARSRNTNTRN